MRRGFGVGARAWFLLAVLALAISPIAAAPEPAATTPVAIPDTPAGQRLAWMIDALNRPRVPQPDELRGQFSPKSFGDMTVTVRIIRLAREALAPVTLIGFREPMRDRALGALLRDRSGAEHRLELRTDEYGGDRIAGWWFGTAATVEPDQIGLSAWDLWRHSPLSGAPIELLNGVTGEPLSPRQRCVGNFLGFCLFTPPRDLATVGIKLTHRLLFSELDTIQYHPADVLRGGDHWSFGAVSRARLDQIREETRHPIDSGKASMSGLVVYYGTSDRKYLGRAGCATVELSPASGDLLYADPETFEPDSTRSRTDPREALWFVPELEPGAYLATARVGDHVGSIRLPRVEPGAFHVLWIPIYLSDEERKSDLPRCE